MWVNNRNVLKWCCGQITVERPLEQQDEGHSVWVCSLLQRETRELWLWITMCAVIICTLHSNLVQKEKKKWWMLYIKTKITLAGTLYSPNTGSCRPTARKQKVNIKHRKDFSVCWHFYKYSRWTQMWSPVQDVYICKMKRNYGSSKGLEFHYCFQATFIWPSFNSVTFQEIFNLDQWWSLKFHLTNVA